MYELMIPTEMFDAVRQTYVRNLFFGHKMMVEGKRTNVAVAVHPGFSAVDLTIAKYFLHHDRFLLPVFESGVNLQEVCAYHARNPLLDTFAIKQAPDGDDSLRLNFLDFSTSAFPRQKEGRVILHEIDLRPEKPLHDELRAWYKKNFPPQPIRPWKY